VKVLRRQLGIVVGFSEDIVYFRITNPKLPGGAIAFAMAPVHARELAAKIVDAADGKVTLADILAEESIRKGEVPG
jgi:hypothetical protein